MRIKALFAVLSDRAADKHVVVVDTLVMGKPNTKALKETLKKLPCNQQSSIIALPTMEQGIIRASRNLPFVRAMQASDLNALDVLTAKYTILPKESIAVIEKTFIKSGTATRSTELDQKNKKVSRNTSKQTKL